MNHLQKPAQALAAAASRGEDRREPLTPGDAAQWLGLPSIVADLQQVNQRLEQTARSAQLRDQALAVASLSGQILRTTEMRAKLGGIPGYTPPRSEAVAGVPFQLTINFRGTGATPKHSLHIEGTALRPGDPGFDAPPAASFIDTEPTGDEGAADDNECAEADEEGGDESVTGDNE